MKFFANGPTIPNSLLRQQELGNVVFLCGAGVSLDSGMPNFNDLAVRILNNLDPSGTSDVSKKFRFRESASDKKAQLSVQLDEIFEKMGKEFGQDVVNASVAKILKTPSSPVDVSHHKSVLKISSNQYNFPQIVTTNFDLLFEKAYRELNEFHEIEIYTPMSFPNIRAGGTVQGISYIHGRIRDEETQNHSYVLSQSDFANAYLLNDYLTKFLHDLISNYTVVFLGYSANDTLVNYLLRGLGNSARSKESNLYAFELKSDTVAQRKWRDFNARVIEFKDFPILWQTLNKWAEKAEDLEKWNKSVCKLATKSPTKLPPYKRGMVNYLVEGVDGARLFSETKPIPSADWICVFDLKCRTKSAFLQSNIYTRVRTFRKHYRLDSDPDSGVIEYESDIFGRYDNALAWTNDKRSSISLPLLTGHKREGYSDLPKRLIYLAKWITNSLSNPVVAWWAIQQNGLHPQLIRDIHSFLIFVRRDLPEIVTLTWTHILEFQSNYNTDSRVLFMFQPVGENFCDEWDSIAFREFEKNISPRPIPIIPLNGDNNNPPETGWEKLTLNDFCDWKLDFSYYFLRYLTVPESAKIRVLEIFVRVFHKITDYLNDIGPINLKIPALYREKSDERREYGAYALEEYEYQCVDLYYFFRELFLDVLEINPDQLKNIVSLWSETDGHFFRKFKLFALNQERLFTADEAARILLKFDQESFWDFSNRRELLFLISQRWSNLSVSVRTKLVNRLLAGPDENFAIETSKELICGQKVAAQYLYWLTKQNCQLTGTQSRKLEELINGVSDWNYKEASKIVAETKPETGTKEDYSPDKLIGLPVESIIEEAQIISERDSTDSVLYKPFIGLVRCNPELALQALSHCEVCDDYVKECWEELIKPFSEFMTDSLILEISEYVIQLPKETVQSLRFSIGDLILYCFRTIYENNEPLAWKLVDYYLNSLSTGDDSLTESLVVNNPYVKDTNSIHIILHAMHGPIGSITMGILELITNSKFENYQETSNEFKNRLPKLLMANGKGRLHVIVILGFYINSLHQRDPIWVENEILPWMNTKHENSEYMWGGFLERKEIPSSEIRKKIKPFLPKLFPLIQSSKIIRRQENDAVNIVVWMATFCRNQEDGISQTEANKLLKQMSQRARNHVISTLCNIGRENEKGWENLVTPFIENSWPAEKKYQTKSTVLGWMELLVETSDSFPIVFSAIRQYLTPMDTQFLKLEAFLSKDKKQYPLAIKFPDLVLELLNVVVSENSSHGNSYLVQILNQIKSEKRGLSFSREFKRLMRVAKRDLD